MIFTYSISADTLNGAVATSKLANEIRAEEIILIALQGVSISADVLTIEFRDTLPGAQVTALNAVVAAHDGNPGVDDAQKFQLVDSDQEAISRTTDINSIRRLAIDVGDSLVVGPQGPEGPAGPVGPQGPAGGLSEFNYAESESESSTTSGSYQQKLRLTTTSLVGGDYIIQWFYEAYTSDIDANYRVQLDDTDTLSEHEHTSADEGDKHYWEPQSGFRRVTLSAGVHNIDIDYNDDGGGSAQIRRARIMLWGIS